MGDQSNMKEQWRGIEDTGGCYEISSLGRVRRAWAGHCTYASGKWFYQELAKKFGVSESNIYQVVHRKIWNDA